MAKPKHGRSNAPSSSSRHCFRPFPRFPSSAVLSALAVIVVAGSPAPTSPPTFLCPSIQQGDVCAPPPSSTTTPSGSAPTPALSRREILADRYVEGSDNLWRKTNGWTLYGSTCCSTATTASTSTQSQPCSSQTPIPTSVSTSPPESFDTSVLPAGWNAATPSSNTESTIILSLATVLAGFICIFVIGCLVWRRRKKKPRDPERKLAQRLGARNDSQDNVRGNNARGKMRMWAKASARWKSNVRQSARRRRKKPLGSSTPNGPSSPSVCDSQVSVVAPSVPSRRDSLVTSPPDAPRVPSRPVSPPTYGASLVPNLSGLTPSSAVSDPSPPDRPHSTERGIHPSVTEAEPLPYTPLPRSDGHIATDDKAQLARIRELASSPPITFQAASASIVPSVSAPEWHEVDDDLDNLGVDLGQPPANFAFPPSFPPPPSNADARFEFLDAHLRYGEGDILAPQSTTGQSEPSFEDSPSAPPIDYPGIEPSAPTLEGEDDVFQDWDEVSTSAVQDSVDGLIALSAPTASSTSHTSFPPSRRSVTKDSILPQYHP